MNRRWIGVVALVGVLAVVGSACAKEEETPAASPTGSAAPAFTTLKTGTLTIGSDIPYPPFESFTSSGGTTGFDVELMDAIAQKLGLTPEWVDANFDTIFTALAASKFDVVASAVTAYAPAGSPAYKITQDRAEIVAFTKPYYDSLQSLAVNASKTPEIATVDDLKSGDRVGVQRGTTGAFWAEENLATKGIELVTYVKVPDMFNALEAGQLVGVINDLPVSLDVVKTKPDLEVVQQIPTGEQYAFAVNKSNTGLLDAINNAMDELFKDGTYLTIFKKYFPEQEPPSYASP